MSKNKALPPSVANPARTAIQAAPAAVLTEFVDAFIVDLSEKQYLALAGLLLLLFSWGQNVIEEVKGKALFKKDAI